MPIMSTPHRYELTIREQHIDSFGHVNNAVYLTLFEEARWELITNNGYGLKRILETNVGPVILQANVKFKRELVLRDRVTVTTQVTDYRRRIGYIHQEMLDADGALTTTAEFTFGLFDMIKRELVAPSEGWMRAFGVTKL
jgi:YbgC/YbaW family acyl-CoA thioester hydrolase